MVPVKLTIQGFLSYRDAEVFDFGADDHRVWMLSGGNGAGKSSVFDAITFALFKYTNRIGSQNAHELINRQSDKAIVEFDFEANGETYRARRSIKKVGGNVSGSLAKRTGAEWITQPGSESDTGFKDQIQKLLGLDYNAFTMSVFLPQNGANRLVQANPEERCKLLKSMINVSEYERLCKRAEKHETDCIADERSLQRQLDGIAEVPDGATASAEATITTVEQECGVAQKGRDVCAQIVTHAQNFDKWTSRLTELHGEIGLLQTLLAGAETVRAKAKRHEGLCRVLPLLGGVLTAYDQMLSADTAYKKCLTQEAILCARLATTLGLPEDADKTPVAAELEKRLNSVERAATHYPSVEAFCAARSETHEALGNFLAKSKLTGEPQPDTFEIWGRSFIEDEAKTKLALEEARQVLGERDGACKDAKQRHETFVGAGDVAACLICGQSLTPQKREEQRRALQVTYELAVKLLKAATDAKNIAETNYKQAEQQRKAQEKRHTLLVQEWDTHQTNKEAAHIEYQKRQRAQEAAKNRISHDLIKNKVGNEVEDYPTPADRTTMKSLADSAEWWRGEATQWTRIAQELEKKETTANEQVRLWKGAGALLPEEWRDSDACTSAEVLRQLEAEKTQTKGAVAEATRLDTAQRDLDVKQHEKTVLETQIDALPAGAEAGEAEAKEKLRVIEVQFKGLQSRLAEAKRLVDDLLRRQTQRKQCEDERQSIARKRDLWKELTKLLGNDGLQRELLRNAETLILCRANETLAQLSGGTLHLSESTETEGRGANTALNLVCENTTLPGKPILLKGLSGSQQFRVSVALAIALGQCFSGNQARLRSVIIDEGFGSLDPKSLEEMADVMHRLGETLERVIVVSHQETFADRFPNRYHISVEQESSRVSRREFES